MTAPASVVYRVDPGRGAEDDNDNGDGKPGISLTELMARGPNTSIKDRRGNTALHVMVSTKPHRACLLAGTRHAVIWHVCDG
jgi:hypothetical protein